MADMDPGLLAQFAQWYDAQQQAAAADNDPDNDRDVTFAAGDKSVTIPWRKARELDLDALLEGTFGVKRRQQPAAAGQGGEGDGSTGGKPAAGKAQGTGQAPGGAAQVASLFRTGKKPA